MRDPYARALRVRPQQVIPDKRHEQRVKDATRALVHAFDDALEEPLPGDWQAMLDKLA